MKINIVGAGPGGLSAAISAKKYDGNADVTVYEKHDTVGNIESHRCGELLGVYYDRVVDIIGNPVAGVITPIDTFIFEYISTHHFNLGDRCILQLDRAVWEEDLAKKARDLNVEVVLNHEVKSISELDGDVIIAADGANSMIRKELRLSIERYGTAFQYELKDSGLWTPRTVKLKIFRDSPGYLWIFPYSDKEDIVKLGCGFEVNAHCSTSPKKYLDDWIYDNKIKGEVVRETGGKLPIKTLQTFQKENVLLVGDAAGLVNPFFGNGMDHAIVSGALAGQYAVSGDMSMYTSHVKAIISSEFRIARMLHFAHNYMPSVVFDMLLGFGLKMGWAVPPPPQKKVIPC